MVDMVDTKVELSPDARIAVAYASAMQQLDGSKDLEAEKLAAWCGWSFARARDAMMELVTKNVAAPVEPVDPAQS